MSRHIEELSKNLAGGMSRRRALRLFLMGVGATLIGGRTAAARRGRGNSICVQFCRHTQSLSGRDFGKCVSASAHCPPGQCAFAINGGQFICVSINST